MTSIGAGGVSVCSWGTENGTRRYTCAGPMRATGATCSGSNTAAAGPVPPDPDRDGDGVPNESDGAPDDPGCSVNCGPQPPPPDEPGPDEPGPEEPGDGQDDGAQVAGELGPKLDAIEQAVLGLGPRIDAVQAAINGARADANADADGIRSALDGIRQAIVAQGPNGAGEGNGDGNGDGDGPVDLSPLTPGNDGGALPTRDEIIEEGDASVMLSQLDTDGFGMTRSCPALSWQQSYDLGWASFDMAQASQLVCWALAILGFMIALGGLVQASFILSQVGR